MHSLVTHDAFSFVEYNRRFHIGKKTLDGSDVSDVEHILAHPELQVPDPEFDAWCDKVIEAQERAKESVL